MFLVLVDSNIRRQESLHYVDEIPGQARNDLGALLMQHKFISAYFNMENPASAVLFRKGNAAIFIVFPIKFYIVFVKITCIYFNLSSFFLLVSFYFDINIERISKVIFCSFNT